MARPHASPDSRTKRLLHQLASLLFIGVVAAACSSQAEQLTSPTTTEVDPSSGFISEQPESLPLIDESTTTSTEPTATPESTTTTEAAPVLEDLEEEPIPTTEPLRTGGTESFDDGVNRLRVKTDGDSLNVRSSPSVDSSIVRELHPSTWYVEATTRVAEIDGALWREVYFWPDETGWVLDDFVEQTGQCSDILVENPIETTTWEDDVDGDGLIDLVNYVQLQDQTLHLRVEFGNGASTSTQLGTSNLYDFYERGWVVTTDFNGDGIHEIQVSDEHRGGDVSVTIFSANGCDLVQQLGGIGTYNESFGFSSWNCTDFGTSDVRVWNQFRTEEGIVTAVAWDFDPATGFTFTGDEVTLTDEEAFEFFDLSCSYHSG